MSADMFGRVTVPTVRLEEVVEDLVAIADDERLDLAVRLDILRAVARLTPLLTYHGRRPISE